MEVKNEDSSEVAVKNEDSSKTVVKKLGIFRNGDTK